ncbi:MAG TPA: isopeptide-forming domain-containing fimbrial protein [Candidatus Blautia merdigallinarum]|uniref:Isopeptide-forming domain-containing fimbrial protein n=1 Tax=Candidatus Blautia merdigallinarum TaxID=2838495 RepID=A0A9D2SJ32_9FIRM|nr:isopeptide-forming domain-containing fimbrial protein [Candidatus Blautia merdigallinarum]
MKLRKKMIAGLLTATMVLGMSVTAFAANSQGNHTTKPDNADKADVSITNIAGNPDVTLYQIASVEYGPNGVEFVDYNWAKGAEFDNPKAPTANEINEIAQGLIASPQTITPIKTWTAQDVGAIYTQEVPAGAYIAVITGADNGDIYNPILLTATYNENGELTTKPISSDANYLFGSTAVAKSSSPDVEKEIKDGVTVDATNGEINTVSVGDVVDYEVTPTVPTYPSNATNKTFFISDRLSAGLTFEYDSLTVTVNGTALTRSESEDGDTFTNASGEIVATAVEKENGFNLNFDYDKLVYGNGSVYAPVITYSGVINDNAVVGDEGNNNKVIYYYGDPNTGTTWKPVDDEPDGATGVNKKEDEETVYTYQLAFLKTGEDTNDDGEADPLAGAVFGIYEDEDCTVLIDTVTTNANGYAVTANVRAGTYYVKELIAPTGYSLNTTVYSIEATWATATTTSTATETERTYTTEKPEGDAAIQVGWMKNGEFYSFEEVGENSSGYQPAYLATEKTTSSTETSFVKNGDVGGTALLDTAIPNTKLSTLPGTGGIGTTIFTIGGCAIMIAAAGLYFASRRKENK